MGEEDIDFLGKTITSFSITFKDINDTTEKLDIYELNLFGDFSFTEIKLYNIEIEVAFDGVIHECDATFMGIANPQRSNAYRLIVTIPELNDLENDFQVVLDFDRDNINQSSLHSINVQIVDDINPISNKMDATFDVVIQNNQ
ncbi:MAG: hypothetical protein KJ971_04805 [Firmicutes bacterium]|nr:hypothetical protein [Bacillota bacterium]